MLELQFNYTVKCNGFPTATIMARAAFNAGKAYCAKFAPEFTQMMPAMVSYNGHCKVFRQEAQSAENGIVLWIEEAF